LVRLLLTALLLPGSFQDDPAALHEAICERIGRAASLRAEFSVSLENQGQEFGSFRGVFKAKEGDRWLFEATLVRRDRGEEERHSVALQSDGRRVRILEGSAEGFDSWPNAKDFGVLLRRSCVDAFLPTAALADPSLLFFRTAEKVPEASSFKKGGSETVGKRETDVLQYRLRLAHKFAPSQEGAVKAWIDRETKLPLRRTLNVRGMQGVEQLSLTLDSELGDADFNYQSRWRLARAQAAMLAESARLFTLFTGRAPDSIDDLAKKPADLEPDVFWPRGGFVMGGIPRDPWGRPFGISVREGRAALFCLGADGQEGGSGENEDIRVELPRPTGSAVGAPSERLAKYFDARVELLLFAALARAYHDTYGELPLREGQLREREAWMSVWSEGGWISAGRSLHDPWGRPYRITYGEFAVRAQVNDPKATLKAEDLRDEERRRLDEIAAPRVRAAQRPAIEALLDRLGDDDFETRVKAQNELREKGQGILSLIDERLKRERDTEVVYRLQTLQKSFSRPEPGWTSGLGPLRVVVLPEVVRPHDVLVNEDGAINALRGYCHVQATFRSQDRDANGVNDFWTGDIAGLAALVPKGGKEPIKMISPALAAADAAPLPEFASAKAASPLPKGGYWYRVLTRDNSTKPPEDYQQDTLNAGGPKTHHTSRFGAVSYPAEYGVTGSRTFIVNESGSIFWKDTQGDPVDDWPDAETLKREWTLLK
jgi:hypothetical protein